MTMTDTRMTAVVLERQGDGPTLQDRTVPEPGVGEVLVRVLACGLCGSDLFLADGGFGLDVFPIVPGHEAAGEVVSAGQGVPHDAVGKVVALCYIDNDPESRWVRGGLPHLGPGVRRMGVDTDGAMAQYVVRPWRTCVVPPAAIGPVELAVLTDALATPYHALTSVAKVGPGDTVLVIGVGGVGSNAVQLARVLGARVVAVARSQRSHKLAVKMGAHYVLDTGGDVEAQLLALTPDGADVVLQCADGGALSELATRLAAPAGRVVLVAASHEPFSLTSVDLIWRELQILGSRGFTADDVRAVQQLYLDGRVGLDHLTHDVRPLSEVGQAFHDLRSGSSTRIVLVPDDAPDPVVDVDASGVG